MATKPVVIKFFAPVIDTTVNALMNVIDQKIKQGITDFTILISSPGGNVFYGLSAYNYLKGIPAKITTHNFGAIDSVSVVLFCAGTTRFSVPQARFLLHGVTSNFEQKTSLEEKQLEETLKGLKSDVENIAKVIAVSTGKEVKDIIEAMRERTILNPEEAKAWGLINEIKSELFEIGSEIVTIQAQQQNSNIQTQLCNRIANYEKI